MKAVYKTLVFGHKVFLRRNLSTTTVLRKTPWHSDNYSKQSETHFGFVNVSEQEKVEKVYDVFKNVAEKYDLMNDAMSMGIHRYWKAEFVRNLGPLPGIKLLDVAGGTGDIAFRVLKTLQSSNMAAAEPRESSSMSSSSNELLNPFNESEIVIADINQSMLDVGKERANALEYSKGLSWLCADAEKLPLEDESFDAYTIAFGIRNVVHIEKVLAEAYRILKPGGRFLCMEFSHVENPLVQWCYDNYSFEVIPVLGQVLAKDWNSYQYLVESIRKFPKQELFKEMIENAQFKLVNYTNLTMGVVAIHSGFKL